MVIQELLVMKHAKMETHKILMGALHHVELRKVGVASLKSTQFAHLLVAMDSESAQNNVTIGITEIMMDVHQLVL